MCTSSSSVRFATGQGCAESNKINTLNGMLLLDRGNERRKDWLCALGLLVPDMFDVMLGASQSEARSAAVGVLSDVP